MSLFGKSNDLNREFIARLDAAKEEIIFKSPDMTIREFTQVTVEPDETALFFKEGKVAGVLPQGRSTLDGALIPFLGDIVDFARGGNMYRAELYFVGTRSRQYPFARRPCAFLLVSHHIPCAPYLSACSQFYERIQLI